MIDHYQALGLPFGSSIEQVKKSYREYAIHFHPDKHSNSLFFTEMFKEIQTSYEVLSNPQTRATFERSFSKGNTSGEATRLNQELQTALLTISQQSTAILEANNRIQFLESEISSLKYRKPLEIKQKTQFEKQPPSRWARAWKVYRKHNTEKKPTLTLKESIAWYFILILIALIYSWFKENL